MEPRVKTSLYPPDTYIWYDTVKKGGSDYLPREGNCLLVSGKGEKMFDLESVVFVNPRVF